MIVIYPFQMKTWPSQASKPASPIGSKRSQIHKIIWMEYISSGFESVKRTIEKGVV